MGSGASTGTELLSAVTQEEIANLSETARKELEEKKKLAEERARHYDDQKSMFRMDPQEKEDRLNGVGEGARNGDPRVPIAKISGGGTGAFGGDSMFSENTLSQNGTGASANTPMLNEQAKGDQGTLDRNGGSGTLGAFGFDASARLRAAAECSCPACTADAERRPHLHRAPRRDRQVRGLPHGAPLAPRRH